MFAWVGAKFDAILSTYVLGVVSTLMTAIAPIALRVSQAEAQLAVDGMMLTHKIGVDKNGKLRPGTTASACVKAYGGGTLARARCAQLMGVAGKTGTKLTAK